MNTLCFLRVKAVKGAKWKSCRVQPGMKPLRYVRTWCLGLYEMA